MLKKGNLAVFESSNISETGEATPTKIGVHDCMHMTSTTTCMNFLSRFRSIEFFMTMDYSPCSEREIWLFLKVAISPKPGRARPLKLVCMYLTSVPTCMNFLSRFQLIEFFDNHGLYIVHAQKGKFGCFRK